NAACPTRPSLGRPGSAAVVDPVMAIGSGMLDAVPEATSQHHAAPHDGEGHHEQDEGRGRGRRPVQGYDGGLVDEGGHHDEGAAADHGRRDERADGKGEAQDGAGYNSGSAEGYGHLEEGASLTGPEAHCRLLE